jgi:hypothetical protein
MSQTPLPHLRHGIAVVMIALILLGLAAPLAQAGPVAASIVLPAFDMIDIVHDRTRLIQFSIVAVLLGIAMLWWGQKT